MILCMRLLAPAVFVMGFVWSGYSNASPQRILFETLYEAPPTRDVNGRDVPMQPVRLFYEERGFLPAWTTADTPVGLSARGRVVTEFLGHAKREGLDPEVYKLPAQATWAETEIALSALLLRYATDLQTGRAGPEKIDPELFITRDSTDRVGILRNAATVSDLANFLETLPPTAPDYRSLRQSLAAYRVIAAEGGWHPLPDGQTIKPGFAGPELKVLWERLRQTGDIKTPQAPEVYEEELVAGVVRFQRRHGLTSDGVIGRQTRTALNTPVGQRIRQIEINMERWRWMPPDLGDTHVFVNLAGFDLRAVRQGKVVLHMRVIVGRPYRRTPVFSDRISYLEVNPDWTVPYKIATQDILPKLRSDPSYLAKNKFQVLTAGGGGAQVNAASIDWNRYSARIFPFQLRQMPGPTNALGQVKFMFPNKFAVYLHDTPSRDLFQQDVRMFSSGCIRIAEPMALAVFLLDGNPAWTVNTLKQAAETGKTKVIRLKKTVPVHLNYLTAWGAADGTTQFRDDIYGRDTRLMAALYPVKGE